MLVSHVKSMVQADDYLSELQENDLTNVFLSCHHQLTKAITSWTFISVNMNANSKLFLLEQRQNTITTVDNLYTNFGEVIRKLDFPVSILHQLQIDHGFKCLRSQISL